MDITVNNMMDILLGEEPNIWKGKLKDWLIWILQLTNRGILEYSETIQNLNGKQARKSLFLLGRQSESTNNQDRISLPGKKIIKTIDEKLYRSIGEENSQEIPVQNVFNTPMESILLPWNPRTTWKAFRHPGPLLKDQLKSLGSGMVVEDHGSTEGGILESQHPTTTELPNNPKLISDRRTHSVLHKSELLLGFKLTPNTAHYPWKNGTTEHINSET